MAYLMPRHVEQRCGGLMAAINPDGNKFTASTVPSLTDVVQFIADVEAVLNGHLAALGLSVPFPSGSVGEARARHYALCGVTALVYDSYARAGGNMDAPDGIHDFDEHIKMLIKDPDYWERFYAGASSTARSRWTDHGAVRPLFNPISKDSTVY